MEILPGDRNIKSASAFLTTLRVSLPLELLSTKVALLLLDPALGNIEFNKATNPPMANLLALCDRHNRVVFAGGHLPNFRLWGIWIMRSEYSSPFCPSEKWLNTTLSAVRPGKEE